MKHLLMATALALSLSACAGGVKPTTPAQTMVNLRAEYLSAAGAFTVYAMQPWCSVDSQPPPLCAEPEIVRKGAALSQQTVDALSTADAVIKAGGVADTSFSNIRKKITDLTAITGGK